MENTHLSVVFLDVDVTEEQRICLIISLVTSFEIQPGEKRFLFFYVYPDLPSVFRPHSIAKSLGYRFSRKF